MDDLMSKLQNVLSDEESMKQIKELAGMLGGEGSPQPEKPALPPAEGIDTVKLMQLGQILQSASREDDNTRLLLALRPLLKEESRQKLDRVIKIYRLMNLYPALKQSGLGGGDLLGLL
ncbi:hypothetical protein [Ruminococcus sp.]|uniref:hypothetical protein n=1 Tax=Ruminococcus sp. TaxID=41978 RepID=UPI0025CFD449|nr:hypothetical protein [Ruminococcus sp.]